MGKEPVSPEIVSQHPLFAGDQTLDKMFSDMGQDAAAPKVDTGKKSAAPAQAPPQVPDVAQKAPAPEGPPTTAESLDVPAQKPGLAAKKPVKDKPVAAGKPAAGPSRGAVVAVSAVDKPGEYVLTVTTTSPVGEVTRTYMDGPPRLVIDLAGRWTYTGPLSLSGKSPLIRLVRVGKHPNILRLVLDLAPEAVTRLREAPVVDRTPNGVVIRLPK
ncbi:AMIN domain-containing protein [Desulfolutivibrio sp.]|uniref:AMIN domain-containing protein n=1 Tax=Desulfolutivibrio sp. TaxID=2773296 RepID=UPI002F965E6A